MIKQCKSGNIGRLSLVVLVSILFFVLIFAVNCSSANAKEFLPPAVEYTSNFYRVHGEPDISVSVIGDTEFERGETAKVKLILSNKGKVHGFESLKSVNTTDEHQMAVKELEYGFQRTTAQGIKVSLVSPSEAITLDSSTQPHTIDNLYAGVLSEPLSFPITISKNIPAGMYELELLLLYEYPKSIRTTDGKTAIMGTPGVEHAVYYESVEKTIKVPIFVQPDARFVVDDIEGTLEAGSTSVINVTYKNIGELPAKDSVARLITMKPLSTDSSMQYLGTIQPGDSSVASFKIDADRDSTIKKYGLDSEIRYTGEDGSFVLSDKMLVDVVLEEPSVHLNLTRISFAGIIVIILFLIIKSRRNSQLEQDQDSENEP